jgi:hypothetical protein
MKKILLSFGLFLTLFPLLGADYNIHLHTDTTPDYADLDSYIKSLTSVWKTDQDKSIAVWRYPCKTSHQMSRSNEKGRGLYDPIMFFNSYPNTFCAYYAAFNQTVWDRMGYGTLYVQLGDHTVSEVSWDNGTSWHMFDSSMRIYAYRHDGIVAACQDIMNTHTCPLSEALGARIPEPGHDYLYHFAKECGTNPVDPVAHVKLNDPWGYRAVVDNPVPNNRTLRNGADSYISGFDRETDNTHIRYGFRYSLDLHPYQEYTRYYKELGDTRDYYRITRGGFAGDPNDHAGIGNIRGNGRWTFTPDLSTIGYRTLMYTESGTVHRSEDGGSGVRIRPAAEGVPAELIFKVNAANVVTSANIHLEGLYNTDGDGLEVAISTDAGMHWTSVWKASTTGVINTDIPLSHTMVGGAFQYLVKIKMSAASTNTDCGVDRLNLTTITQVNRYTLPHFQKGGNKVHFRLGRQSEFLYLWPVLHKDQYQGTADSWANIWTDRATDHFYKATVRPLKGNRETYITWKFTTPTDITQLYYGGELIKRTGPADTCWAKLLHSYDGTHFTRDWLFDENVSPMNEMHYAHVTHMAPGTREAWLKYELRHSEDQTYNSTGISDAMLYVFYTPRSRRFKPVEVTFNWTEHHTGGDVTRQHTKLMTVSEGQWEINVAGVKDPTMNWVRLNLKGHGPDGDNLAYGYSDGMDVGTDDGYDKKKYDWRWLDNAAFHKTYSVSRSAAQINPDTGGTELTDGNIVPSTDYTTTIAAQKLTALWDQDTPVAVTIDLEEIKSIAALRITTHQPNNTYCHPSTIRVEYSEDGKNYTIAGTIRHDEIWSPPGNYLPWERDQSQKYADLPDGGRLTYPFWLVSEVPFNGRYIRCTFTPQNGKGLGISEIQAFTALTVTDWPDREITLPKVTDLTAGKITAFPLGEEISMKFKFKPSPFGGAPPYRFDWDFSDGGNSSRKNPSHRFAKSGVYPVSVVVTDRIGAKAWAETIVTVTGGCGASTAEPISAIESEVEP